MSASVCSGRGEAVRAPGSARLRLRKAVAMVLVFWAGLFAAGLAQAALRVDLDAGWRFRTDPKEQGLAAGWTQAIPDATRPVDVPHTWNLGTDEDFEGVGWYFRRLELPGALAANTHVELNFGATFYAARVWLNGIEIGRHEGGHTAYAFDISQQLRRAGSNLLVVAIDNRPSIHSIPGYAMRLAASKSVWYDWWHYGGIVRDVWLDVSEGATIRRQALAAELIGPLPGNARAAVTDGVDVQNVGPGEQALELSATVYAPDGLVVARASGTLDLAPGARRTATLSFAIDKPVLWNVGDGQLYQVVTELRGAGATLLDTRSDSIGLRRIELRDRKLLVNGRQVRLTGLSRHEDSPWEGLAETRGTIRHDWDELRTLHTTLTRPVHYPQPPAVLDYADRHGILLVPEIPVWQFSEAQLADPRVLSLAQRMMTEMIAADGNHPSIFAWSVCNESDASLPGGLAYVRSMKALIRRLDPARFVSFADSDVSAAPWRDSPALHEADFIMANAYFGSWSGGAQQVEPWLDFMARTYPDKAVVISEFGFVGPFAPDAVAADKARIANFQQQLDAFAKRDFVAGAILWTYQDYKSHRNLAAGETTGYVDHGVVDEKRQHKPSFDAYEIRNRPLTSRLEWVSGEDGLNGFRAVLQANDSSRLPSYAMTGYRAEWRMVERDGRLIGHGTQALPDLAAPFTLQGRWAAEKDLPAAALQVRVIGPDGAVALADRLDYLSLRLGFAPYPGAPQPRATDVAAPQ